VEAVERLSGLELVLSAAEHEPVGSECGAQWACPQFVVLQNLCVPNRDDLTGVAACPQTNPAHEVLAKVDQRASGRRCPDLARRKVLLSPHERAEVRRQPREIEIDGMHSDPTGRPRTGAVP